MSNYFRVLKRLENEKTERETPAAQEGERRAGDGPQAAERVPAANVAAPTAATAAPAAVVPVPPVTAPSLAAVPAVTSPPETRARDAVAPPARAAAAPRGIATLFDNIRALASARPTRMLVFAGASAAEPVGAVTADLARHAERHGVRVLLADLRQVGGRATLLPRPGGRTRAAHLVGSGDEALTVDLDGGAALSHLEHWLERSASGADLVLINGPPLAESMDAALLASACDGLIIVAESGVTERTALQAAAERARIAGCRTLGVVMHGTQDRIPAWMHRLMGAPPLSRSRKD